MKHLTLAQKCALKTYLECGKSKSEIAKLLSADRSTIYQLRDVLTTERWHIEQMGILLYHNYNIHSNRLTKDARQFYIFHTRKKIDMHL